MSDTSPAIPESIDPANQHKALTAGQQAVIKKLFRRLIIFLFVLFIFSFLDRINIGFAGLTMGRDLGLSATMFGLATTLFYAAYVIFGIPSNIMLSIVGARRWIATIMVLWGIASTATMFATGPTSLYVLRILVGITEAGFLPGILLYLTFWFPAYFRARANALFMVAMPVTTALGSIVSGYILSLDGVLALKGWQWLFLLEGFPSVLLGVMVWFWLDDSPDKAKWLTKEDKKCLQEMMDNDRLTLVQPEGAISHHAMQQRSMWREIFTPVVMMYTLAYFCLTNTLSAISIWTPQILQSFNLTIAHRRSLRGRSRTGGLHWNRPDNPRTNHQQRGNKPQSTVKAAGQIFQPADHKRTQSRTDIASSVDHRNTDRACPQADGLIRCCPENCHCAE